MKKMKQVLAAAVFTMMLAVFLSGCGGKNKLAAAFDEKTVKETAIEDVENAMTGDYEGWVARFAPELQASLTQAAFDSYLATLEGAGEFQEFGKTAIVGQEQEGVNYAVVIMEVKYEKNKFRYTIAYNEDMKLVQFVIA